MRIPGFVRPWDQQPVDAVAVRPGGFRHLFYGQQVAGVDGGIWTPTNSPPVIVGAVGPARQFTAASSQALTTPARGIDPSNLTMYALIRRRNTSNNHAILSVGAGSNDRVLLYLPNAAVAIFSGAGGTTGQASTTVSSYTDTNNYVPIVARVSGSAYRDVSARFTDGSTITASNTASVSPAAPTVVAAGAYYTSGALTAGFYADADIAVAGVIPYSIPDRQVEDLLHRLNEWAQWLTPRGIWVPVSVGGGGAQTVAIGQATETDTAQAFAAVVNVIAAIGQASEADTAQALASAQSQAIGQAAETDSAQAFAGAQAAAIAQAAETDLAQPLTSLQAASIGQAQETDVAQTVTYSAPGAIAQAQETDEAQPLQANQVLGIGQAAETDSAQALTYLSGTAIGMVLEIDTAGAFSALAPGAIGQAAETNLAQAFTVGGFVAGNARYTITAIARRLQVTAAHRRLEINR